MNGSGSSTASNETNATTALAAPTGLSATAVSISEIDLTWTDNSSTASSYNISRAPDVSGSPGTFQQVGTAAAAATGYDDTSLTDGTKYWYEVQAYNAATNGSVYTSPQSGLTFPGQPTGMTTTPVSASVINMSSGRRPAAR